MSESGKDIPQTPRILIVDDDPGQRSLLNSFLKSQDFDTAVVDSGERALEALRTGHFSMMISDVRMPGLSGLETLRQARKEKITVPVLLVTAFTDVRDAVAAMRDGAVNYLAKPIDLDELLATVQHTTGISKPIGLVNSEDRPQWSSDGSKLAFTARVGLGSPPIQIWVVGADGHGLTRIA